MTKSQQAADLWKHAISIDGLNVSNWDSDRVFQSLRNSGITAINATSAVWENCEQAIDNIASWYQRIRDPAKNLLLVRTAEDLHTAKRENKIGIILGWQNTSPLESDLKRLAVFHELGVRIIQITYNERNLVGNGCYERSDGGLSNFGLDAVKEMNRLGILIDLSHVGDRTTLEAADISSDPVCCTHANARAYIDHPRNKTDDALKLITEKGGVIGANAFPAFFPQRFNATIEDYVDAIEDLIERIGIDHVALGTDYTQDQPQSFFDWIFSQQGTKIQQCSFPYPDPLLHPTGMEIPDKLGNVAYELLQRGHEQTDITKIIGGNWLRLFDAVWKISS